MTGNATIHACATPFLPEKRFPSSDGFTTGRYCFNQTVGNVTEACCLPCPITDWVYSSDFSHFERVSGYISIISLVLNSFLLLTFVVIPQEKSHRHYLSIGLTVSLILIAIAFVIPLGTNPNFCYNEITPNSLRTNVSCGFTGALVEAGAMGAVVWILLRSIWTALRIMTSFERLDLLRNISIAIGVGLPAFFLALSLPITSVSYSLGSVCVPSGTSAFSTWFVWILTFAGISSILQVVTILYCVWRFAASSMAGPGRKLRFSGPSDTSDTATSTANVSSFNMSKHRAGRRKAWRKVRSVLALQWRSIVMSIIIINLSIYFGINYIQHTNAVRAFAVTKALSGPDLLYFACLEAHGGNKYACLHLSAGTGLSENRAIGTLFMASFIGILVFLLMLRWSMFVGWWELLKDPSRVLRGQSISSGDFFMVGGPRAHLERSHKGDVQRNELVPEYESHATPSPSHETWDRLDDDEEKKLDKETRVVV